MPNITQKKDERFMLIGWKFWWSLIVGVVLVGILSFGVIQTISLVDDVQKDVATGAETNELVKKCVVDGECGPRSTQNATTRLIVGITVRSDCLAETNNLDSYNLCVTRKMEEFDKIFSNLNTTSTTSTTQD